MQKLRSARHIVRFSLSAAYELINASGINFAANAAAPTCQGFLIYMKNQMQMPKHPKDAEAYAAAEPDKDLVFANMREFIEYHSPTGAEQ